MSDKRTLKNYNHILNSFADRAFYYRIIATVSLVITFLIVSCIININEVNRMSKVVTTNTTFTMNLANINIFTTLGLILVAGILLYWIMFSFENVLFLVAGIIGTIFLVMIAIGPLVSAGQETQVQNWIEEVTHSQIDHQKTEDLNIIGSYKMSDGTIVKKESEIIGNKRVVTLHVEEKAN
jgi:glucan phosphoethanolaminetransferase (alkaline phosphatase superfamily)